MKILKNIWKKFKEKSDQWFFYGFLLTFPLEIRKIIFFYPLQNNFNEYSAIFLYLSDIFLVLTLLGWFLSILRNKYSSLSTASPANTKLSTKKLWIKCLKWIKCSTPAPLNVPRGTFLLGWNIFKDKLTYIPLILVIWSFISLTWSDNQVVALFRSIKLLEFFLLYLYLRHRMFHPSRNVPPQVLPKCSTWNIFEEGGKRGTFENFAGWNILEKIILILVFWGLFESFIGIWQFFSQHSIGLFWLKESLLSPDIPGVAKLIIGQEKYIRAYGLFPHPNILGGFLLVSIIFTYFYIKTAPHLHHKLKNVPRLPRWFQMFHVEHLKALRGGTFWKIVLAFQVLALILTFSKSALIGLLIAFLYIFINSYNNSSTPAPLDDSSGKKLKCSTPLEMFHVEHCSTWNILRGKCGTDLGAFSIDQIKKLRYYFILSLGIFGFLLFYFKIDLYSLFIKSLEERFLYLTISLQAITQHMLWGLGQGQFVLEMQKYASTTLEFWQFQPVHNVFLIILSELGMIGLFLFVWFLLEIFNGNVPPQVPQKCSTWNIYLKAILLGFVFIMIFDHYLWDIQQGSLMLWMILGFISVKK